MAIFLPPIKPAEGKPDGIAYDTIKASRLLCAKNGIIPLHRAISLLGTEQNGE